MTAMKRIIAFVLFALMIYAGGFFVVYGFDELGKANSRPLSLNMLASGALNNSQVVSGTVYQQVMLIGEDTIRPNVLNIPIGEPKKRRFYLVPLKYEENAENIMYYTVCLSNPESIERMEKLGTLLPKPEKGEGLELTGVALEMTPDMRSDVFNALCSRTALVGVTEITQNPTRTYYENRILPWTVFERTGFDSGLNSIITVIIGAVLILGGGIPSVILGIKIYREKHYY